MPQPTVPRPALTATTVPRRLVRSAAVEETFLTDWERSGPDWFTIFAQWPRVHQLHVSPDRSSREPLPVAESVRQCGALLAHAEYDVPFDHGFVLKELHLTTTRSRASGRRARPPRPPTTAIRYRPSRFLRLPRSRLRHAAPGGCMADRPRPGRRSARGGSFPAASHQYAELDRPAWIEETDETRTGLEVRGFQSESPVFGCAVGAAAR